jgi:hypothetical protein
MSMNTATVPASNLPLESAVEEIRQKLDKVLDWIANGGGVPAVVPPIGGNPETLTTAEAMAFLGRKSPSHFFAEMQERGIVNAGTRRVNRWRKADLIALPERRNPRMTYARVEHGKAKK